MVDFQEHTVAVNYVGFVFFVFFSFFLSLLFFKCETKVTTKLHRLWFFCINCKKKIVFSVKF